MTRAELKVLRVLDDHENDRIKHIPAFQPIFNGTLGVLTDLAFNSAVFRRLANRRFLNEQPYELTTAGRAALQAQGDER